jgi:hypothetical protein
MSKALRHSHLNPRIAVALIDPVVSEPIRPAPDTERCQAYIFGVDAFTQRRISELREEGALQHQNVIYAELAFHTRAERHTRDLRQERLKAIRQELMHLNKPFQRELP